MPSTVTYLTLFGITGTVLGILAATLTIIDHMAEVDEGAGVTAYPKQAPGVGTLPAFQGREAEQYYQFGTIDQGL